MFPSTPTHLSPNLQSLPVLLLFLLPLLTPTYAAFSSHPSAINTAATTVTIRSVTNANDNVRCVVVAHGATPPTAANVNAGQGNGGSGQVAAPPAVTANSGSNADVSVSGLTTGVRYNVYCATASGGALSNVLVMYTSGFTTQPTATSVEDDRMVVQLVSALSENVRCVFIFNGGSAPTAAEVNAGTGSGGSSAQSAPIATSATAGSTLSYVITGLAADTDYDVYCATVAGQISSKGNMATSGFATEPIVNTGGYASGQITVTFVSYNTEAIRCAAFTVGASTPAAAAINGGSASHQGTSPGASSETGGASASVALSGLTVATQYDIYCATANAVRSQKLAAYASGFSAHPTKSADSAGTTVTIAATTTVSENVRCVFVPNGATAPSAANVIAGVGNGGSGQLGVSSLTSATAGSSVSIYVPSLTAATQ